MLSEIQHMIGDRSADIPEENRVTYRIGINIGDIIVEAEDIYGDGVNIAARLEGLAEPGGIYVSATVHDPVAVTGEFEWSRGCPGSPRR